MNDLSSAADRYALLPENDDFIFDFNQEQQNPGNGGQLIAANRKTFPALVGSGAGMAVGRIDGKSILSQDSYKLRLRDIHLHVPL